MKTGIMTTLKFQMCDDIFGGSEKRWSLAWRWIFFILMNATKILLDTRVCFGLWMTSPDSTMPSNKKCFNPLCEDLQNNTHEERTGLAFLPFDIFGFIDCSIDRINRPFSGPAGDYEGAG
jgi:hypothetical protein